MFSLLFQYSSYANLRFSFRFSSHSVNSDTHTHTHRHCRFTQHLALCHGYPTLTTGRRVKRIPVGSVVSCVHEYVFSRLCLYPSVSRSFWISRCQLALYLCVCSLFSFCLLFIYSCICLSVFFSTLLYNLHSGNIIPSERHQTINSYLPPTSITNN